MAAIEVSDEVAAELEYAARQSGQTADAFLREAILLRFEDLEDICIGEERLANPSETISIEQVKKNLGLKD